MLTREEIERARGGDLDRTENIFRLLELSGGPNEANDKKRDVLIKRTNDLCETARRAHDYRAMVVKAKAEADRLIKTLNAYAGAGIPTSDAREAFAFLRQLRTEARKLPQADGEGKEQNHADSE